MICYEDRKNKMKAFKKHIKLNYINSVNEN